jgi:hypothetical protein
MPAPTGSTVKDLAHTEQYLECIADELRAKAEHQVFANVPQAALDGLDGRYQFQGELGAAAGDAQELAKLRTMSTLANQAAACASGIGGALAGLNPQAPLSGVGGALNAGASCANAVEQASIARQEESVVLSDLEIDGASSWEAFRAEYLAHVDKMVDTVQAFEEQATLMRAALASIDTQRARGRRELAKAMMLGADANGKQYAVNTVMRRRYNTLQIRYEHAYADAVRLAWVARRSIEQRLGFHLSDLRDDMALVEAPARWADALCTSTGINYTRIRSETGLPVDDYADAYIGDYVQKLERTVQSYEHDFPFNDSRDVAVISLRDDVAHTRAECVTSVPNLLAYSARLDTPHDPVDTEVRKFDHPGGGSEILLYPATEEPEAVWRLVDCDGTPPRNCIVADRISGADPADRPIREAPPDVGEVPGYRVTFGGPGASLKATSALAQEITLDAGYYRLSWFGRYITGEDHHPMNAVKVIPAPLATDVTAVASVNEVGWTRYFFLFYVPARASVMVAIVPDEFTLTQHEVDLAGLMLEDIDEQILGLPVTQDLTPASYPPAYYVATEEAGMGVGAMCEDTDGAVFRTLFTRGCTQLCPTGYGACDDAVTHCYWETTFGVTVDAIERRNMLGQSGFAHGNYNYRSDGIAVNLVGTGLRDCADSPSPSTCWSAGWIPYTIEHLGPYVVRNHRGELYDSPLFQGRIEHGRALAAERYISNPISGTDRSLLEDYWHRELRGRPITGSYLLRIWDADGFRMRNLEDVQIVLDYRYWTRFE